jgi:hypothetical protein
MLKCLKPILLVLLIAAGTVVKGQSYIGMPKERVNALVKQEHKEFRRDNSVVKQHFNYLKFVNGAKTRTWILYFTDEDICKTSKLVCDYSDFDDVVEELSTAYNKVGDSRWEYLLRGQTIEITLTRQEWYFTVRESLKKDEEERKK